MAEKAINLKTWEVQAVLEGRKTQTRQVIKPQPSAKVEYINPYNGNYERFTGWLNDNRMCLGENGNVKNTCHWKPPYKIGDILWVREKFGYLPIPNFDEARLYYSADKNMELDGLKIGWCSPMHMKRKAARIFLKVMDVRVERLQSMKKIEFIAEGMPSYRFGSSSKGYLKPLWNSTIKKEYLIEYGWDANPWVWVIEFERVI